MGRGAQSPARVAVVVRAGAAPLWWLGLLAAGAGALVPGLIGRRIGLLSGAALFLVTAGAVALVRRGRYTQLAGAATRAARTDHLQDGRVTLRSWRRAHRRQPAPAFLAALGSSIALPAAGGALLAGAGAGLWAKAVWLGRREQSADHLYRLPADLTASGPADRPVTGCRFTGIAAGDAVPGGARRR